MDRREEKAIELILQRVGLESCVKCLIETDDDHRHQMSFPLVNMEKLFDSISCTRALSKCSLAFRAVAISDTRTLDCR